MLSLSFSVNWYTKYKNVHKHKVFPVWLWRLEIQDGIQYPGLNTMIKQ